jgi:hypothetical protein
MRDERETVARSVEDDLLAAEIRDAVWMGDDDCETLPHDPPVRGGAVVTHREPRNSKAPLDD